MLVLFPPTSKFELLAFPAGQHFSSLFWYRFLNIIFYNISIIIYWIKMSRRWHEFDCFIPSRPLWFLWWENILFVCLLNPIKSRLFRDIRIEKFGCQTCSRNSACLSLVVMSFKGSKIKQVVNDAKNAGSSFIFWNEKKKLKSKELSDKIQ